MIDVLFAALTLVTPKEFANVPLEQAMQQGVTVSPDVAQAQAHVSEEQAMLLAARGSAAPAITANYAQSPQGGNTNNTIQQRLFTLGGQVTLGDYFAYAPAVRQAVFALAQAQSDLAEAQRSERVKIVGQYYAALKAQATVSLQNQNVQGARSDLRSAQIRFRAGDAPRLDVVRAEVALTQSQAALDAARVDFSNDLDALSTETGRPPADFGSLRETAAAQPPMISVSKAVARALATRSDLASAEQAVRGEEAAVSLAQRGVLPTVTVAAGYTRGTDSGVAVAGPSATLNASLPISHEADARVQAERARLAAATYRADSIRRQISLAVSAAVRTYDETQRAATAATRARTAAEEELNATQIGYRSGASSSLDVSDARRTYVQAALNELNAVYDRAKAASTLMLEVGA